MSPDAPGLLLPWACLRAADGDDDGEPAEAAGWFPYESEGRWRGRPEVICRRAFDVSPALRLLVQHNEAQALARLDGALVLEHTDDGLAWSVPLEALPATSWARDAIASLGAGVYTGTSPGFSTRPGDFARVGSTMRVKRADLYELSIVGQAAYGAAAASLRADGGPRRRRPLLGAA